MSYIDQGKPPLDELAHYGIRGMKWGVRKSKSVTGVGRTRGALLDYNQRATAVLTRQREGRPVGLREKYIRGANRVAYLGLNRYNKALDKRLAKLDKQKRRLEGGKLAVRDVLDLVGKVSMFEAGVSVRDRKG